MWLELRKFKILLRFDINISENNKLNLKIKIYTVRKALPFDLNDYSEEQMEIVFIYIIGSLRKHRYENEIIFPVNIKNFLSGFLYEGMLLCCQGRGYGIKI